MTGKSRVLPIPGRQDDVANGVEQSLVLKVVNGKLQAFNAASEGGWYWERKLAGAFFYPRKAQVVAAAEAWALVHKIRQAEEDKTAGDLITLVIIDMQMDFCLLDGSLYVPGAEDDVANVAEFILRNLERIGDIIISLDSHLPLQIHTRAYWLDTLTGRIVDAFTMISEEDIASGRFEARFHPEGEPDWGAEYTNILEQKAKKTLMAWPYHTMVGGVGSALMPALFEVILFWSIAKGKNYKFVAKGTPLHTENYAFTEAEVITSDPDSEFRSDIVDEIGRATLVYIAGEAKSHCVLESITSMEEHYRNNAKHVLSKMRIMGNCMSSVGNIIDENTGDVIVDFDAMANQFFAAFQRDGIKIVDSTDPIG